jgi:hypothetical protein
MCTGRPTWQSLALRNYNKGTMTQIYMDLEEIIEIDTKNKVKSYFTYFTAFP